MLVLNLDNVALIL